MDPIIAAALSQRATSMAPPQPNPAPDLTESDLAESDLAESQHDGGLGWPGEPGEGSGLGWPDATTTTDTTETDTTATGTTAGEAAATDVTATDASATEVTVAATPVAPAARDGRPARRRSSWLRWFGASSSVPPTPSGSNAA